MSIEDLTGTIVRKICMSCSREFADYTGVCPHDGNILVPLPQDPYVGKKIADKYQVLSVLGTGGMGVVYLARHETMQCNVAIKMLRAQFISDQTSVKRFTQEAIAARRLQHPNVITTYDHGFTSQGQPYIVMDCLKGKSLADEIKRLKQISVERIIHIFSQACDALDHAHKQGVIHRDLKPSNIMLIDYNDDDDYVKVVDFGVAKIMPINNEESQTLTQAGEVCGSPVYMSPEQCQGLDLDRRADVYSMGVVLYEALTGKLPLVGKNMVETMSKHINEKPLSFSQVRPDLYIPEKVEQVVMRALSKQPEMRQQSMGQLGHELMFSVPRPGQSAEFRRIVMSEGLDPGKGNKVSTAWVIPVLLGSILCAVLGFTAVYLFSVNTKPSSQNFSENNLGNKKKGDGVKSKVQKGVTEASVVGATNTVSTHATSTKESSTNNTASSVIPIQSQVVTNKNLSDQSKTEAAINSFNTKKAMSKKIDSLSSNQTKKVVSKKERIIPIQKAVMTSKPHYSNSLNNDAPFDRLRAHRSY